MLRVWPSPSPKMNSLPHQQGEQEMVKHTFHDCRIPQNSLVLTMQNLSCCGPSEESGVIQGQASSHAMLQDVSPILHISVKNSIKNGSILNLLLFLNNQQSLYRHNFMEKNTSLLLKKKKFPGKGFFQVSSTANSDLCFLPLFSCLLH